MDLGIVTYNIAKDWDLDTLLDRCEALGYTGVELRTGHAHGVEAGLSAQARAEVRAKFDARPVALVGLGTTFEFHSPDPEERARHVQGTKDYVRLARDLGASGVKVRPNAFPADVPRETTIKRIGACLREAGAFGADHGVQIRLEVHGPETCHPPHIRAMLDAADHPNVVACWNSNRNEPDENGSIRAHFDLLRGRIGLVHINELWREDYPWAELFALLRESGYDGYCLAEIPGSADPEGVLRCYRVLFRALGGM